MGNKNKFCILWLWWIFLFAPFLLTQEANDEGANDDTKIEETTEKVDEQNSTEPANENSDKIENDSDVDNSTETATEEVVNTSDTTSESETTSANTEEQNFTESEVDNSENSTSTNEAEVSKTDETSTDENNTTDAVENAENKIEDAINSEANADENNTDASTDENNTTDAVENADNKVEDAINSEANADENNTDTTSSEDASTDENNTTDTVENAENKVEDATNSEANTDENNADNTSSEEDDSTQNTVNLEEVKKRQKDALAKIQALSPIISSLKDLNKILSEVESSKEIEFATVTFLVQIEDLNKNLILQTAKMANSEDKEVREIAINSVAKVIREYLTDNNKSEDFKDEDFVEVFSSNYNESFTSTILFWYSKIDEDSRDLAFQTFVKMGAPGLNDIVQFLRLNPSEELKTLAVNVTYSMGDTKAIPKIIALLGDVNPFIQSYANQALGKFGRQILPVLVDYIKKEKNDEHIAVAISIIGDMGKDAKDTIPLLIEFLKKKDATQLAATRALKNMGEDAYTALPSFITNLRASNWEVRQVSAEIIGSFGEKSSSAITPLMNQYSREDNGIVRASICRQFGKIGKSGLKAVDILIEALQDYDDTVIKSAAESLGELGVDDRKVIDALVEVLSFFNVNARVASAKALGSIGKSSRNVIRTLNTMLQTNNDPGIREGVAMALGYMGDSLISTGSDGKRSINLLTSALKYDRAEIVKVAAADALGKIGDNYAISALIDAVRSDLIVVREVASRSLVKIGNSAVVDIIRALRSSRDEESRIAFVSILSELGKDAIPAVITLNGYLDSWRGAEREALVKTLGKIGVNNRTEETLDKLVQILNYSGDKHVNPVISETLKQFGSISIPHVIPLLKNKNNEIISIAKDVIEHLFDDAAPSLKQIVEKNDDEILTSRSLEILSKDKETLPIILNALKYESLIVQETAQNVIVENMGKIAIQPLINIIEKSHLSMERQLAGEILARLGKEAVSSLMNVIAASENEKARLVAIDALYDIGSKAEKAIPVIKKAITIRKDVEQNKLAKCLGRIGPKAIPAILELLENENDSVQNSAIEALGETGVKDSISYLLNSLENERLLPLVIKATVKMSDISLPTLMNSLDSENFHIRFACAAALFEIGSPKAIASLAQRILVETNPMVKYMLQIALDKCQEKLENESS